MKFSDNFNLRDLIGIKNHIAYLIQHRGNQSSTQLSSEIMMYIDEVTD